MTGKYFSFWLISILLIVGTVLLFIGGPDYHSTRSLKNLWDLGHILYFALLAIVLSRWNYIARRPLLWQWFYILSITLVAGITIELLQYGTNRTPNTGDIIRDLTGSFLALTFGPMGIKLKSGRQRHSLQLSATALTLIMLWPLTKSVIDETIARYQFPLLSSFDTPFEIDRWSGKGLSIESITKVSDSRLLKIPLTIDRYSGVALKYFDGNWKLFSALKINLYNPDTIPLQITVRINDRKHNDGYEEYKDRFNRSFMLTPGSNLLKIDLDEVKVSPAGRDMDMNDISGLGLFTVSLTAPRILYLNEVKLIYR